MMLRMRPATIAGARLPSPPAYGYISRTNTRRTRLTPLSSQAAAGGSSDSHDGHAVLHDFCMTIPSAAALTLTGAVRLALHAKAEATATLAVGLLVALLSVLSLKTWRTGGSSTPYTLLMTGAYAGLSAVIWNAVQHGGTALVNYATLAIGAVSGLFTLYNIIAGGNPPKKTSST